MSKDGSLRYGSKGECNGVAGWESISEEDLFITFLRSGTMLILWGLSEKMFQESSSGVKDMQSGSEVIRNGAELLQSERELTTKVEKQPWPQLVHYALICCCICGCIFQEAGIVVRSAGEE